MKEFRSTLFKSLFIAAILLFLHFFLIQTVLAVNLTIKNYPENISNEEFNLEVSIDGPNPGSNYLRIDLFKDTTSNYFGETFNGTAWYSGSNGKEYYPITISSEGTASAILKGRVGNPSAKEYLGPGLYKLRVRRYTTSGSQTSGDQQIPVDVNLTVASVTPNPTLVTSSSPSLSPSLTPIATQNKISTAKASVSSLATTSPKISGSVAPLGTSDNQSLVLGASEAQISEISPEPSETPAESIKVSKFNVVPVLAIFLGIVLLSLAGYTLYRERKRKENS